MPDVEQECISGASILNAGFSNVLEHELTNNTRDALYIRQGEVNRHASSAFD